MKQKKTQKNNRVSLAPNLTSEKKTQKEEKKWNNYKYLPQTIWEEHKEKKKKKKRRQAKSLLG